MKLKFTLNGKEQIVNTTSKKRLIDLLREDFGLTGTKEGCSIGECGACTVVMDGLAVNSCLILAGQIQGTSIVTVEGLEENGQLSQLQENFLNSGAVQCGFCTPGMLLSAYALLQTNPAPSETEINETIAGNLCRCTGYKQVVEAVIMTADKKNRQSNKVTK